MVAKRRWAVTAVGAAGEHFVQAASRPRLGAVRPSPGSVRVALLAESFLPHMNGVTNSVLQVLMHLERKGHEALVIAPGSPQAGDGEESGARTQRLLSLPLPSYPQVRVTLAGTPQVSRLLTGFAPDVVHLASPLVLGWHGVRPRTWHGFPRWRSTRRM